jgi:hypothetical protein
MNKKQADLLKKQQAKLRLANQFTEVPEEREFAWHLLDAVAFAAFITIVVLFFA